MSTGDQVKLALSKEAEVLSALERKNALRKSADGTRTLELLFDSRPFTFHIYPGGERNIIPVPSNVASALRSDSRVLVGDALSGQFRSALTVMGKYNQSEGDPELRISKTQCQYCRTECEDPRALARHLLAECQSPEARVPSVLARIENEKAQAAAQAAAATKRERGEREGAVEDDGAELVSAEDEG